MKKYFVILALMLLLSTVLSSCFCKEGKGNVATQDRQLAEFDEIEVDGQAQIILDYGSPQSIKVSIDSNLIEYVKTEVSGMKLKITESRCFKSITDYKIYITATKLTKLSFDGSVKITGETPIKSEKLSIKNNGAVVVQLALDVNKLNIDADGSGELKLLGRALNVDVNIDGAGSVDAFGLQSKVVDAKVKGAGTFKIDVSEEFSGEVGENGKIYYKGNPKKVDTDVSGSGTIQAK
jgi:hypothetical protein